MYAGPGRRDRRRTARLFDDVHHPYTEALLASIPQLDQDTNQRLYAIPGLPPDLSAPASGLPVRAPLPLRHRASAVPRSRPWPGTTPGHPCLLPPRRAGLALDEIAGAGDLMRRGGRARARMAGPPCR